VSFTTKDVLTALSGADGDYHDGIEAHVSIREADDSTLHVDLDAEGGPAERFVVTVRPMTAKDVTENGTSRNAGYAVVRLDSDRELRTLDYDDEVYDSHEAALESQGGELIVGGDIRIVALMDVTP